MFLKNLSNLPCLATVLKMRRWKLVTEKSTLPRFGRNYLKKKYGKFMRKISGEVFDNMDREGIIENLQKLNEAQSSGLWKQTT